MKKSLLFIILFCTILSSWTFGEIDTIDLNDPVISYEHGEIIHVEDKVEEGDYSYEYQACVVRITSGVYKDEIVEIENVFSENEFYNIRVKPGDSVILHVEDYDITKEISIADFSRQNVLYVLLGLFLLALVVVGKVKGLKAVITITLTIILIYKVLLPGMLTGKNPLLLTIGITTVITFVTLLTISGFHTKSFAAIIGTLFGVIMAGSISIIAGNIVKLTGLSSHEASMLLFLPQEITFDFKDLLFSGILLGALGAVMDVAMSIASSIQEIYLANPKLSGRALFNSGMTVGQDIMGTMSNTLILAYTGSSIPLLLVFMAYDIPAISMFNMDLVASEIVRSLAGSIGLILTIPITAFVSVVLIRSVEYQHEHTQTQEVAPDLSEMSKSNET